MVPEKIIRVDQEVYSRLQSDAKPFEDTPNSVLRRLFGLDVEEAKKGNKKSTIMDSRIIELLDSIKGLTGQEVNTGSTKGGQINIKSKAGVVFAYIVPQKHRLNIGVKKEMAQAAGCTDWQKLYQKGWFSVDDEAHWYVPNGDITQGQQVAKLLAQIWK